MIRKNSHRLFCCVALLSLVATMSACATGGNGGGGSVAGNENGSEPVNQKETYEYQKAVLKCYKTGGTRVVKIEGALRCF